MRNWTEESDMAMLNLELAGHVPAGLDLELVSPGAYEVVIVDSRLDKSARAVEFELVVLGPVFRGARLRDSFTLGEEASMGRLKTFAVAARYPNPDFISDTEQFHGRRCRVRVERTGGPRSSGCGNFISGYGFSGVRLPFCGPLPGSLFFDPGRMEAEGAKPSGRRYPWKEQGK